MGADYLPHDAEAARVIPTEPTDHEPKGTETMIEATDPIERAGYVARIYYDESPESPDGWCNIGTLEYSDRHGRASHGTMPRYWDEYGIENVLPDALVILPVRAYDDRNGTVLDVADSWEDANGWIYATDSCACGCGSKHDMTPEQVRAALVAELAAWQQWAQGDVYGVVVYDRAGTEVDSCWGFYGLEWAETEARGMLDIEPVRIIERFPDAGRLLVN